MTTTFDQQMKKAASADGFIAALDQSGGSTPKALKEYGVPDEAYTPGEESMYDMVHQMRTRIITSPSFSGDKVMGAILFENTMDREIEGLSTGQYLWERKQIVPFIKCDKGLAELDNGVQLMKPMPGLAQLLSKAKAKSMFGTKMRSVIKENNAEGIKAIVAQQVEIGKAIIAAGLCPILEPEVDITSPDKEAIEDTLKAELLEALDSLDENQNVMIKLSLPTKTNLYTDLIAHPRCVRVVALSGGYPRDEANAILTKQTGMIASFSRALLEGLSYDQDQADFDKTLAATIDSIYQASKSG